MPVPDLACMAMIASFHHLPPRVPPSIQAVEGSRAGMVHRDADGSGDPGVMQVNTRWVQALAGYAGLRTDVVRARLIRELCFGIAAAGAIPRSDLDVAHANLMLAIGHDHSHMPRLNLGDRLQVTRAATRLFAAPGRP